MMDRVVDLEWENLEMNLSFLGDLEQALAQTQLSILKNAAGCLRKITSTRAPGPEKTLWSVRWSCPINASYKTASASFVEGSSFTATRGYSPDNENCLEKNHNFKKVFVYLAAPAFSCLSQGSSLIRDRTQSPCIGSAGVSQPFDHQRSPHSSWKKKKKNSETQSHFSIDPCPHWFCSFKRLYHMRRPRSQGKPRGPGSTAWWEAAARVAGLVSWQPRNAPPRVKQVAAASLLPLALGSSACSSAVRLPVGVGELMSAVSSLEALERRARPPLGERVDHPEEEGKEHLGGRARAQGGRRASEPGNAQSEKAREALIKRAALPSRLSVAPEVSVSFDWCLFVKQSSFLCLRLAF